MRDILLMGAARERSTRIKNKIMRTFGYTTLFELYLRKLETINKDKNPFNNVILALNKEDKKLCELAKKYNVKVQERNSFSVGKATMPKDIYHFLENYDDDYVMWINACFPFLKIETVIKAANYFVKHNEINSLHCVKKRQNWFWNPKTNRPFNLEKTSDATTQQSLPVYESVHCFHIHNIKDLLEKNIYWSFKKNDPYLYSVEETVECIDIDNPFEFELAEVLWKYYK